MQNALKNTPQIIFITSETRSGSNFLSYMLGTNPQSAHLGEFYRPFKLGTLKSCRLCEAKGFDQCEIMGNLRNIPLQEAHTHALNCFKKHGVHTLIDCSKDLDWIDEVFQIYKNKREDISLKLIHLVREPRGWISSERRRHNTMTIQQGLERWKQHFYSTSSRTGDIGISSMRITYEELLLRQQRALHKLSQFMGFPQLADQYQYWNQEHHGFGGNGAAYNNLAKFSEKACNTGDDSFYKQNHQKTFYDLRWKEESDSDALNELSSDASVQNILAQCGISYGIINASLEKHLKATNHFTVNY